MYVAADRHTYPHVYISLNCEFVSTAEQAVAHALVPLWPDPESLVLGVQAAHSSAIGQGGGSCGSLSFFFLVGLVSY